MRNNQSIGTLQGSLRACASLLQTAKGVYVLHHAREFGEYAIDFHAINEPRVLSRFAGLLATTSPVPFEKYRKAPPLESIEQHLAWMLEQIESMPRESKCCRWIGFLCGAAANAGFEAAVRWKDLIEGDADMSRLTALAVVRNASKHYVAHYALGYMQGWLWANGQGSIDDFRVMNDPAAERSVPA